MDHPSVAAPLWLLMVPPAPAVKVVLSKMGATPAASELSFNGGLVVHAGSVTGGENPTLETLSVLPHVPAVPFVSPIR